jgi:membrane fusion protein
MIRTGADNSAALDRPSGLLPKDPPARAARWTGQLLLALALATGVFAVSFKLPETVVAPFVIVPIEGTAPMLAPVAGQIARVLVRTGQSVKAGDPLFEIRSDQVRDADARLRLLTEDQRALVERVRALDEAHASQLKLGEAETALAERDLSFREQHLGAARNILARKEKAVADGLLPQISLLSDRMVMAESENARVLSEQRLQQLALQRQERLATRERQRGVEAAEAEKLSLQIASVQAAMRDSEGELRTLRAPFDAVVLNLALQTPGDVIALGTELAQLARLDGAGQARLALPEVDLARLHIGQTVRLFVAAYPYQRYGSVASELTWISPAALSGAQDAGFFALAKLQPGTADMPLGVGMTGEARILVGRRTLLDLAMEPMRALRERLIVE